MAMRGKLSATKGTLIEMFIEFENGQVLTIQPLSNDAAVIAFGKASNEYLTSATQVEDGHIVVFDHSGEVVGDYEVDSTISAIENTVLYVNGTVWSGPVFDELEKKELAYVVLTEDAVAQIKNSQNLSFGAEKAEAKPTIIVGYKGAIQPLCGWHHCNKCRMMDKFIPNGLA